MRDNMKKYYLFVLLCMFFSSHLVEAGEIRPGQAHIILAKGKSEKNGKPVKDYDGNDWPDWGKVDA